MPTWRSKHRIRLKNRSGNIGKKQKKKRQKRKRQVPQQFRISFTLTPLGLFGISRKRPAISGAQHEGTEWATRTNAESSACHRCHVPLLPHSLAFCSSTLRYRLLPTSNLPTRTKLRLVPVVPATRCHQAAQMQKPSLADLQGRFSMQHINSVFLFNLKTCYPFPRLCLSGVPTET